LSIETIAALLAESDYLVTDRDLLPSRLELDPYDPDRAAWRLAAWPNVDRLDVAMRLGLDVGACEDLLAGRSVDPLRLDQAELAKAREKTLIRLVAPIDALGDVAA
jgi:hypothetical protein